MIGPFFGTFDEVRKIAIDLSSMGERIYIFQQINTDITWDIPPCYFFSNALSQGPKDEDYSTNTLMGCCKHGEFIEAVHFMDRC